MSRLSKNIFYNLSGKILLLVLSFFAIKFIFGQLGEDALGIIFFTLMLNAILGNVFEMGITATSTREISNYHKKDPDYVRALISTGSLLYWGSYLLAGLAVYFMAPIIIDKWVNLATLDSKTATYILRVLGIAALVALPKSFLASLFKGIQRMEFNNGIDVSVNVLRQLGTIAILNFGGSLFQVVYWLVFCYILEIVIYMIFLFVFFPPVTFLPKLHPFVIKRNFGFASNMTLITILWAIYQKADKAIISKLLPIGVLGFYGLAQRAVSLGSIVSQAINTAAFPALSSLQKEDRGQFLSQYRKLQDTICFGNVPLLALIPFALLPTFSYLLNREIAESLHLPTTLLCLGAYLNGTLRIPVTSAIAMGKPNIMRDANFFSLLVIFPLTVILIYYFGLVGAGVAVICRMIFLYAYAVPRICSSCLKIPPQYWYAHVARVIVLIIMTYGLAWLILSMTGVYTIVTLFITYTVATAFFIFYGLQFIGSELKDTLRRYFHILKLKFV